MSFRTVAIALVSAAVLSSALPTPKPPICSLNVEQLNTAFATPVAGPIFKNLYTTLCGVGAVATRDLPDLDEAKAVYEEVCDAIDEPSDLDLEAVNTQIAALTGSTPASVPTDVGEACDKLEDVIKKADEAASPTTGSIQMRASPLDNLAVGGLLGSIGKRVEPFDTLLGAASGGLDPSSLLGPLGGLGRRDLPTFDITTLDGAVKVTQVTTSLACEAANDGSDAFDAAVAADELTRIIGQTVPAEVPAVKETCKNADDALAELKKKCSDGTVVEDVKVLCGPLEDR